MGNRIQEKNNFSPFFSIYSLNLIYILVFVVEYKKFSSQVTASVAENLFKLFPKIFEKKNACQGNYNSFFIDTHFLCSKWSTESCSDGSQPLNELVNNFSLSTNLPYLTRKKSCSTYLSINAILGTCLGFGQQARMIISFALFLLTTNKSEIPYECIQCNIEKDHTLKRLRKVDFVADQRIFELYSLLSKQIQS